VQRNELRQMAPYSTIDILPLDGSSFEIRIDLDTPPTVHCIKKEIEKLRGWNIHQQMLLSESIGELENDSKIDIEEKEIYLELRKLKVIENNRELRRICKRYLRHPTLGRQTVTEEYGHITIWQFSPLVSNMSNLFRGNQYYQVNSRGNWVVDSFNEDISGWDTRYVTSMCHMFTNNVKFNRDIGKWDVSRVNHIDQILNGTTAFRHCLDKWDVSQVETAYMAFRGLDMKGQDFSGWRPSRLQFANGMFSKCQNVDMDLSDWTLPAGADTAEMFEDVDLDREQQPRKFDTLGRKRLLDKKKDPYGLC